MTLSKSPVFGNYIHSEPKFIGAFPDRKDYPFNTGTYGTTLMDENPVKKEAPETFKIGDRVKTRVNVSRDKENLYGVVVEASGSIVRVDIPSLNDRWWFSPEQLKKEFAVGDRVKDRRGVQFTVVEKASDVSSMGVLTYRLLQDDGISCYNYGCSMLTYIPEEKKEAEGAGTVSINGKEIGHVIGWDKGADDKTAIYELKSNMNIDNFAAPNGFSLNQPIFMDKQAENRLHVEDVHKVDIKFMTQAEIDRELVYKHYLYMPEVKIEYKPQTTYSATIVLASGRVVNVPNPNEKAWTLKSTEKVTRIEPVLLDHEEGNEDVDEFVLTSFVEHEEGLCWLKDMSRIIEQKDVVSPFETKFSYVTEIRKYVRKPIETPIYECTMPALRCLW